MRSFSPSLTPPSRPCAPSRAVIALMSSGEAPWSCRIEPTLSPFLTRWMRSPVGLPPVTCSLGLGQQRHVLRHHARLKAGIGVGRRAFGGIGHLDVGLGGAGIRGGIGERVAHAACAIAVPVGGIAHPHQDLVQRDAGGNLGLGQHRAEIPGDEGHLGIRLGGIGVIGVVGRGLGSPPTSVSMRWALKGGIFAERSLKVIDRLPETRMNGRTLITSRLPTLATVETRTRLRAAVASPGGGRRSALCRLTTPRSLAPNAPRSALSTRSGTRAKVISPSREAKTAPPIRAAPQSPVRMVPLNHCTETRRRSITAASLPSTESGGS